MFVSFLEQIFTIYSKHETGLFNCIRSWHLSRNLLAEIAPIRGKHVGDNSYMHEQPGQKVFSVSEISWFPLNLRERMLTAALMAQCAEPWEISHAVKHDSKKLK